MPVRGEGRRGDRRGEDEEEEGELGIPLWAQALARREKDTLGM